MGMNAGVWMGNVNGLRDELKKISEREIKRMEEVLKDTVVKENRALEIYNLALSYHTDAKHFFEKGDFIRAFEAVVISWTYIDAGLHMDVFEVPEKHRKLFTMGD